MHEKLARLKQLIILRVAKLGMAEAQVTMELVGKRRALGTVSVPTSPCAALDFHFYRKGGDSELPRIGGCFEDCSKECRKTLDIYFILPCHEHGRRYSTTAVS